VRFALSKWYLDCVSEEGEAAVLYWVHLQWGALRVHYGAVLSRTPGGATTDRHTLRPGPEPALAVDGSLAWSCKRLRAAGSWAGSTPGVSHTLLESADGRIDWHCVCPGAEAVVEIDGRTLRGRGYAERLTSTIAPRQLPFDELRWGRFLSSTDAIAWIDWRGPVSRSWLLTNGSVDEQPMISDGRVATRDGSVALQISDGQLLRTGRVTAIVPRPIRPALARMPGWRDAEETKWVARGTAEGHGGSSTGWIVHEVVRWV